MRARKRNESQKRAPVSDLHGVDYVRAPAVTGVGLPAKDIDQKRQLLIKSKSVGGAGYKVALCVVLNLLVAADRVRFLGAAHVYPPGRYPRRFVELDLCELRRFAVSRDIAQASSRIRGKKNQFVVQPEQRVA